MTQNDKALSTALVSFANLKKLADKLPLNDDYDYASVFDAFSEPVDSILTQITDLMQNLCPRSANLVSDFHEKHNVLDMTTHVVKTIDESIQSIEVCIDSLLEKSIEQEQQMDKPVETQFSENSQVPRPELDPAPNNDEKQFFAYYWDNNNEKVRCEADVHPYEDFISGWSVPQAQLRSCEEVPFPNLENTPLVSVNTLKDLEKLKLDLESAQEFSVDLEHHQYHSYFGFTCLMQISTLCTDYIVDTIALRKHMWILKDSFLSPLKTKIFHGAAEDIKWLQRDFGLYVCNMFDTGIALQRLRQPRGLAHLLKFLCGVDIDKSYQLADWRIRPLNENMLHYARSDTHYLIYCYRKLRNMLALSDEDSMTTNALKTVWEESRQLCLTLHKMQPTDEESCDDIFSKHYGNMDAQHITIVRELFQWRDRKCRGLDESWHAVMSNGLLARIAKQKPLDREEFILYFGKRKNLLTQCIEEVLGLVKRVVETVSQDAVINYTTTKKPVSKGNKGSSRITLAQNYIELTGTLPSIEGLIDLQDSSVSNILNIRKQKRKQQSSLEKLYEHTT